MCHPFIPNTLDISVEIHLSMRSNVFSESSFNFLSSVAINDAVHPLLLLSLVCTHEELLMDQNKMTTRRNDVG